MFLFIIWCIFVTFITIGYINKESSQKHERDELIYARDSIMETDEKDLKITIHNENLHKDK